MFGPPPKKLAWRPLCPDIIFRFLRLPFQDKRCWRWVWYRRPATRCRSCRTKSRGSACTRWTTRRRRRETTRSRSGGVQTTYRAARSKYPSADPHSKITRSLETLLMCPTYSRICWTRCIWCSFCRIFAERRCCQIWRTWPIHSLSGGAHRLSDSAYLQRAAIKYTTKICLAVFAGISFEFEAKIYINISPPCLQITGFSSFK